MATSTENEQPMMEQTSIVKDRRESIDKKLQQRPTENELKERHILLDTKAAPALQAAQYDLEKQLASDELKKRMQHRPERDELIGRNIISDSKVAPALQAQQKELQKHMRQNSLEKQLQSRPDIQQLVEKKILSPEEADAPAAEVAVDEK